MQPRSVAVYPGGRRRHVRVTILEKTMGAQALASAGTQSELRRALFSHLRRSQRGYGFLGAIEFLVFRAACIEIGFGNERPSFANMGDFCGQHGHVVVFEKFAAVPDGGV